MLAQSSSACEQRHSVRRMQSAGCQYSMPRLSKRVTDADEQTKQITIGDETSVVLEEKWERVHVPAVRRRNQSRPRGAERHT
jgi:hypothetical protein